MTFLDKKPDPEVEFAAEIKAAEVELAEKPEPVSEPEAEAPETETLEDTLGVDKAEPVAAEKSAEAPAKPTEEETKVPLSALHQARREKQEMERQYNEMLAYVQSFQQQQQQPQPEPEKPIDPNEDPIGAFIQSRAQQEQLANQLQWMQQERVQQHQANEVTQAYQNAAVEFKKEQPDLKEAYEYALNSRARELQALGGQPQQIHQQLRMEEMQLAAVALQNRQNPAKVIYEFAKARGYAGPKPAEPAKPAPSKAVELLAEKAAVSTSLSTGGKSPTSGDVTDNDGVNLKGAAFDAWFEKRFTPKKHGLFAR